MHNAQNAQNGESFAPTALELLVSMTSYLGLASPLLTTLPIQIISKPLRLAVCLPCLLRRC